MRAENVVLNLLAPSGQRHGARMPRVTAPWLAILLALGLAGCKVGPDFTEPHAPLAARWQEWGDPTVRTSASEDANWWRIYNDPALDHLEDVAYHRNLTLLAAGTKVLEARAALGIAAGEFYPQSQQIGASVSYNQSSNVDPTSIPGHALGNFWRTQIGPSVAWEIDLWGKFRRGVTSADASYLASIASYDDVLVSLMSDVAATYIGIRTLEQQMVVARDNIIKQQKSLQIARDRYKGGTATALDAFQAENVLAQTEAVVPQLTSQIQAGKDALAVLLGMPPSSLDALLAGPQQIPMPHGDVAIGMPADLLRRRPDIRAAELSAAAQSEQIGMAKAELYPAFTLNGFFGIIAGTTASNQISSAFTSNAITFAFGPSFSWPILNYGRIINNVRVQDAALQNLLVNYKNTVLKAQREVEDNLSAYAQGRQRVAILRRAVAAATSALRIAVDQYVLGTRDFTTVLTAEQNLYVAQNNLVSASGSYATSLANLYRALGGGWQIRKGDDFVDAQTRDEMRKRTDWGNLLPAAAPPAQAPGQAPAKKPPPLLPGPADIGPDIRPPNW
jgi:NodT family efflux transporter outer membrane factor (OMF) lipoprotein